MPRVLSHPFRLLANGQPATVEADTVEADRELLAVLATTRPGERRFLPGFGTPDPTFEGFEPSAFSAAKAEFGPPVDLVGFVIEPTDEGTQLVSIEFAD